MGDRASALADAVKHPTKKRTLARLVREDMTALSMPEASKDCISWTSTPTPHVTLKWVLDMHDTVSICYMAASIKLTGFRSSHS
jgi:hypothetical protein